MQNKGAWARLHKLRVHGFVPPCGMITVGCRMIFGSPCATNHSRFMLKLPSKSCFFRAQASSCKPIAARALRVEAALQS